MVLATKKWGYPGKELKDGRSYIEVFSEQSDWQFFLCPCNGFSVF